MSCSNLSEIFYVSHLQTGEGLIADQHPKSDEVRSIMDKLNKQWAELSSKAQDKGNKLRQASAQHTLNRALDDAQVRFRVNTLTSIIHRR